MTISMIVTAASVLVAVISATWTIAQQVNKPDIKGIETNFASKLDAVTKSMADNFKAVNDSIAKIIDLLHETRQGYLTKVEFDRRMVELDKKEDQQTKRFVQKYKQVYDKCSQVQTKLDNHIIQWARQKH